MLKILQLKSSHLHQSTIAKDFFLSLGKTFDSSMALNEDVVQLFWLAEALTGVHPQTWSIDGNGHEILPGFWMYVCYLLSLAIRVKALASKWNGTFCLVLDDVFNSVLYLYVGQYEFGSIHVYLTESCIFYRFFIIFS